MLFWPIVIISLAILALALGNPPLPDLMGEDPDGMRLVYLTVLGTGLAFAAAGRLLLRGGRRTMVHTAIWCGVIGGVVTAYSFRDQGRVVIDHVQGQLMPSVALSRSEGAAELRRAWDGHYRAEAEVNGIRLRLLVDTGASMVMIPYEQVASIGIDPADLRFSVPVSTANGPSTVAPIQLASIRIGPIVVFDVTAAVAQPGRLKTGLLGMSFLDRLSETSFRGDTLILRQAGTGTSRWLRPATP